MANNNFGNSKYLDELFAIPKIPRKTTYKMHCREKIIQPWVTPTDEVRFARWLYKEEKSFEKIGKVIAQF
jgi:hypothetical protein